MSASAPSAPGPPGGQGSISVPGPSYTPDQYRDWALQDPGYLALQNSLNGNEGAFTGQMRGAINKGVIDLGMAPTDSSLAGYLDPATATAAASNPLSQAALLTQTHTNNLRDIQNQLAARGAYDSGELTYGLTNENQRDTGARADAMSKFMDYANGLFAQLGNLKAGDASALGQELGNAVSRQLGMHPGTVEAANWDDASGTYVDSQGNHYDQWGNPTTAKAVGPVPGPQAPVTIPSAPAAGVFQAPGFGGETSGVMGTPAQSALFNNLGLGNQMPVTTNFGGGGGARAS